MTFLSFPAATICFATRMFSRNFRSTPPQRVPSAWSASATEARRQITGCGYSGVRYVWYSDTSAHFVNATGWCGDQPAGSRQPALTTASHSPSYTPPYPNAGFAGQPLARCSASAAAGVAPSSHRFVTGSPRVACQRPRPSSQSCGSPNSPDTDSSGPSAGPQ